MPQATENGASAAPAQGRSSQEKAKQLAQRFSLKEASVVLVLLWAMYGLVLLGGHLLGQPSGQLWKESVAFFTAGSVTGALALANYFRQIELQRASLLRELTTKFFTDATLYTAYIDLIYNFQSHDYDAVVVAIENAATRRKKLGSEIPKPFFVGSTRHQYSGGQALPPGKRRFHPFLFQGSEEEARLDAVLSYLDMIAYHLERDHLRPEDIKKAALGEIFRTVANKPFITEYMILIGEDVRLSDEQPGVRELIGATDRIEGTLYSNLERHLAPLRKGKYTRERILSGLAERAERHQLFYVPTQPSPSGADHDE